MPVAADVDLEELARLTERFTGADLESACKKAALVAIAEFDNARPAAGFAVARRHFGEVLNQNRSLSTAEIAGTAEHRLS